MSFPADHTSVKELSQRHNVLNNLNPLVLRFALLQGSASSVEELIPSPKLVSLSVCR